MLSPFALEQLPKITDTHLIKNPELAIKDRRILISLGTTVLTLALDEGLDYPDPIHEGVWPSQLESLATVEAHRDAGQGIRRYRFNNPDHTALHVIDDGKNVNTNYCSVHSHSDVAELNVIVPSANEGLTYNVFDGDKWSEVSKTSLLWFPPGVPHCAYAEKGSGLFFVTRLPIDAQRYYDKVAPGSRMVNGDKVDLNSDIPAFEQQYGQPFFAYLAKHPDEWRLFNLKMEAGLKNMLPAAIIDKLPLPSASRVVDVGGGLGYLLGEIKNRRPGIEAILFDLPFVTEQARLKGANVNKIIAGDMLVDKLPEAEVYILTRTLHDLKDDDALKVLKNIRSCAAPESRVLIIDAQPDNANQHSYATKQQKTMELLFKSPQHTYADLCELLKHCGWKVIENRELNNKLSCVVAIAN